MDFNKVRERANQERERRMKEGAARGEQQLVNDAPKDSLLHDLVESLNTGKPSKLAENIRQVDRLAKTKSGNIAPSTPSGGGLSSALSQHLGSQPQQQQPQQQINERDQAFNQQFQQPVNRQQNQASLSEQLAAMNGGGQNNMHQAYQQMHGVQNPAPQPQQNPSLINEQVNAAVNQIDFNGLLQETLKNTVLQMYANEKIQAFLNENKDVIKKIVKETLIELSRAKKKTI